MTIYWIDESYVRDNLPVDYSLLSGNILPALQQAHLINARDLLGDRLFDYINLFSMVVHLDNEKDLLFVSTLGRRIAMPMFSRYGIHKRYV